ncbi:hypothetical protein BDQ17DRAFT_1436666 [Cyathus striatus]|nr:hypothetical protein BDQ17DRAFT_1436666 [Cyathus striatus]
MPTLQSLTIESSRMKNEQLLPHLVIQFLKRSGCSTLQELVLSGILLGKEWNAEELRSITRLEIEKPRSIISDIKWLSMPTIPAGVDTFSSPFPNLSELDRHIYKEEENLSECLSSLTALRSTLTTDSGEEGISSQFSLLRLAVNFHRKLRADETEKWKLFMHSHITLLSVIEFIVRYKDVTEGDGKDGQWYSL